LVLGFHLRQFLRLLVVHLFVRQKNVIVERDLAGPVFGVVAAHQLIDLILRQCRRSLQRLIQFPGRLPGEAIDG
jgi:hypothetical protein